MMAWFEMITRRDISCFIIGASLVNMAHTWIHMQSLKRKR